MATADTDGATRAPRVGVRFHAMAKPGGPLCNLDCAYCYYLHKAQLLETNSHWRMTDETLETFVRQYLEPSGGGEVVFSWQGGEPTLRGIEFFRKVVALEAKWAPPGTRVENDLQTNGTQLDDEWCEFLAEHRFLVGLSVDGPAKLHDAVRPRKGGGGSFGEALAAAKRLRKHGVEFNTLTCVGAANARRPLDVYRFLTRELGSTRLQFIPVVEPRWFRTASPLSSPVEALPKMGESAARPGRADSVVHDWCVDPEDWGYFLSKVFDDWHGRDVGKVWVYYFESALKQHMGGVANLCSLAPVCGKALAIEHNGDVYSCDHFVYPEYRLGNIREHSLAEKASSGRQERFGLAKDATLPRRCRECEFLWMCAGECPKNRFIRTPDGEPGLNYLCAGWKAYFSHIRPSLAELAKRLEARRAP